MISIGLIEDHALVRNGLKLILGALGGYKVQGEYNNVAAFLADHQQGQAQADIYLLDYSMPGATGLDLLKVMQEQGAEYKFILLTQHLTDELKIQAYEYDARGFLNKDCTAQELKEAIDHVAQNGYHNFSEILRLARSQRKAKTTPPAVELSQRETQLLELVCDQNELTYQQIADRMNLSIKSIDAYRAQLFEKLNVKSKVGLVLYCHRHHLTKTFE